MHKTSNFLKGKKEEKDMHFKKLKRNIKGISPILAVLMMIVVAVAGGLVTYAWVMGYLDFTTGNAGKAIKIQSIGYDTELRVYIQNVGEGAITLDDQKCLYIDGLLTTGTPDLLAPAQGDISTISWIPDPAFVSGQSILVRVVTHEGTFNEATWTYTE